MKKHPTDCDGIRCIVETKRNGRWQSACYDDEDCTKVTIFPCKHEASSAIMHLAYMFAALAIKGEISMREMPEPSDFRITRLDQGVIDDTDLLADCADAISAIDAIRSKP